MLQIAIVEDEADLAQQTKDNVVRYLNEHGLEGNIAVFNDGMDIAENYKPIWDILLLDIEMPLLDGMSAAQKIREQDATVVMIFITRMAKYAIKGYEVDALDFILKPITYARRKWVDCFEGKKPVEESQSEKAFAYVEKIFALEACWRDMSPDERQKHRMAEMKPVMDAYWDFLSSFSSEKDSNLQKAQTYSLHQRKQLEAVLLDGRLELTNNVAERSVKPFVMARRNFLFCDTAKGADASAQCFSMIETAKRNKLDPFGYLLFLLQELPKPGSEPTREQLLPLLPWSTALPEYCYLS